MKYDYKQFEAACLRDVSLWTRAHDAGAQISPDFMTITTSIRVKGLKDLNAWPWWAKALKIVAQASRLFGCKDTGIGDTFARLARPFAWLKGAGKCTKCDERRHSLNRRFPLALHFGLIAFLAFKCSGFNDSQLILQQASQWPAPHVPDMNPAHAALLAIQINPDIATNSIETGITYPPGTAYLIVFDGPGAGAYNETNIISTLGGTLTNITVLTTNSTPFHINSEAIDAYGDIGYMGNDVIFYGWTTYADTNWLFVTNPATPPEVGPAAPIGMGTDLRHIINGTNITLAIFTNPPWTSMFFATLPGQPPLGIYSLKTCLRTNIPPGQLPQWP